MENTADQVYCVKCGKFLANAIGSDSKNVTVWEVDDTDLDSYGKKHNPNRESGNFGISQRYIVICPQCNSLSAAINKMVPLACSQCGYFFQAGIDKAVPESQLKQQVLDSNKMQNVNASRQSQVRIPSANTGTKQNPLAGVSKDTTSLRLIVVRQKEAILEEVNELGGIIGGNGTILSGIKTNYQISIWHSPAGWYAKALVGQPLYNGVPINVGNQFKLNDGDILMTEREQIRVEIV